MKLKPLYLLLALFILASCSSKKEKEDDADNTDNTEQETPSSDADSDASDEYVDKMGDVVKGFDSIDALAASLVKSLDNKNYREYLSHTMTREMEIDQAAKIQDSTVRENFIAEYGFSLREEKHYFDFTIKYLEEHDADIGKAILDEVEYVPYKEGRYKPLELYEVFIPVENEYPMTVDVVVIKIEDKYYLTSEMGI